MKTRRLHPVLCFLALAAFLVPVVVATGGVMVCQEWAGKTTIEFVGDHEPCEVIAGRVRDHDSCGCCCTAHPCDDTSLAISIAPLPKGDDTDADVDRAGGAGGLPTAVLPQRWASYDLQSARFVSSCELAMDRMLGPLRTVRLIL